MEVLVNIFEFTETFADEAACIAFLEKSRWENGEPVSPFTGGAAYRIATRPGVYKCKDTRQNFSVRNGTIFEESPLPLKKWFFAIFLLNALKKGVSSVQLAKYLGTTQRTGWFMMQRIRYAVEHPSFNKTVRGAAEVEETHLGGKRSGPNGRSLIVGIVGCDGKVSDGAVPNVKVRTAGPTVVELGSKS